MTCALLLLTGCFIALGIWQVERRAWKHDLIAAVDARAHAAPVAAPGPAAWPAISRNRDAYRRVTVEGHFLAHRQTLVRAVSDLGSGYWVLAPLDTGRFTVLVNRGFILPAQKGRTPEPQGPIRITGLLRITEPGGGFLRTNDPAADNWYSRDVPAIAGKRQLGTVAPYFIDADASLNGSGQPVGGLTVVSFSDNHMVYALTWFGMAALCLWGLWRLRSSA
ncbi:MAG TPA: SURF1 family protein [Sphingobium sp.]|uniref:SURF1 family protein n=1 Tax=Sphingobium sp. TaxID=1912891 RepID=UPI002ED299B4